MAARDLPDPEHGQSGRLIVVPRDLSVGDSPERRAPTLSDYDQITALANPTLFLEQLVATVKRHRSRRRSFALIMLELDDLRPIVARYGAAAGDQVFCEFARRLKAGLRGSDLAARLGDQRFAVILEEILEQTKVLRVLERIERQSLRPIPVKGAMIQVQATIACTLYPQDGIEPWEILHSADEAVCRMKASGRIASKPQIGAFALPPTPLDT